jgi:hypothetical protein
VEDYCLLLGLQFLEMAILGWAAFFLLVDPHYLWPAMALLLAGPRAL